MTMTATMRSRIFQTKHNNGTKFEGFTFDDEGSLRFKNQIYIPLNDELRILILNEAHIALYMAHLGVMKMRANIKPLFF
jgi:hypothetical protein